MIRKLFRLYLDHHINRGFKQLEAGSRASELELTPAMARAYDRDARSYASRRAHARAEARRLRAHRLEMEVAAMRGATA